MVVPDADGSTGRPTPVLSAALSGPPRSTGRGKAGSPQCGAAGLPGLWRGSGGSGRRLGWVAGNVAGDQVGDGVGVFAL